MFPSEILLQTFCHLQEIESTSSLSVLRQVSKEWYLLLTPVLLSSHEITLIDLTNVNEYHQGRCRGHDDDIADCFFFENSHGGTITRRLYDLSFVRELKITYGPSSYQLAPGNSGTIDRSQVSNPLLPRLKTVIFTYQALRYLHKSSVDHSVSPSASRYDLTETDKPSRIIPCLKDCIPKVLILQYPSIILEKEDLDLSSNFALFLRNLIDQIPSLQEIRYENLHLQPISLPALNPILRNVTVVFSRHSKCPDMGGTILHYRRKQIMDSLKELTDDENQRFYHEGMEAGIGEEEGMEGTRYVFKASIGSIPQWCSHVDIREQAKCSEDEIKGELVKLYPSILDQQLGEGTILKLVDQFSLVEDENEMDK